MWIERFHQKLLTTFVIYFFIFGFFFCASDFRERKNTEYLYFVTCRTSAAVRQKHQRADATKLEASMEDRKNK